MARQTDPPAVEGNAPGADVEAVAPILRQLGIQIGAPEDAAVRIAQRLADSGTLEDLLGESQAVSWRERAGIPYRVRAVDWSDSDLGGGVGFFAIVTAVNLDTNQTETLTTGATNVLIQLAKMLQNGWLEQPVKYESRKASSGFEVGRLAKAEDPSTPF